MTTKPDTTYTRPDGARVRVDRVANGQVYYCAWRPGFTHGFLFRMPSALFNELIDEEGMEIHHDQTS